MATGLKFLQFYSSRVLNSTFKNLSLKGNVHLNLCRFIYTENSLGINRYLIARSNIQQQFVNIENTFREKMKDIIDDENSIVFTEDLKAMLHLINKNPRDIDLITQMMYKFNNQNKELRFGTYVFGPVIMRAFYYLDEPDLATSIFFDPKLSSLFNQQMSYMILMSLLYKHKKYAEVRKVFDAIKEKVVDIQMFPKNALIIVIHSCYKEATEEALQYALRNFKELSQKGLPIIRRVTTLISALAIQLDSPEIGLEILLTTNSPRFISIRCLKIAAFCKLNRLADVLAILRQSVEAINIRRENYFCDVIDMVTKDAQNMTDNNIKEEILNAVQILRTQGLVDMNLTLDSFLSKEIDSESMRKVMYPTGSSRSFNLKHSRLGLKDLL